MPAFGAKDKAQSRKQLLIIVIIINYQLSIINCLLYFCAMETNRQKKIGGVLQKDLVDILQGEVRKNGIQNLIISVSKVTVTRLTISKRLTMLCLPKKTLSKTAIY